MTDDTYSLSRRQVLGGIGAIGVASAGAGLGTSAYFSDQEQFEGNTITAGEFGLTVEQSVHTVDQDGMGPDEETFDSNADGGVWYTSSIDVEDAKPGDEYEFCWDVTVLENPGYVAVAGTHDDMTGAEAGNVDADDLWDVDEGDLSTLGAEATATLTTEDSDGNELASADYGSLGGLLSSLEGGILVSDAQGAYEFEAGEEVTVCLEITIPSTVGNELQGAVLEQDMTFYAEQARHNDPSNVQTEAATQFGSPPS